MKEFDVKKFVKEKKGFKKVIDENTIFKKDSKTSTDEFISKKVEMKEVFSGLKTTKREWVASNFRGSISSKSDAKDLIVFEDDSHKVIMKPLFGTKVTDIIKSEKGFIFKELIKGTDLEYIVSERGLKENIIIKEKLDNYEFSFSLKLKNLKLKIGDGSRKIFLDKKTGEEIFEFTDLFMYDALEEQSSKVSLEISDISSDELGIKLIADKEWIEEDKREFPIIIDPGIVIPTNVTTRGLCNDSIALPVNGKLKLGREGNQLNKVELIINVSNFIDFLDNRTNYRAILTFKLENGTRVPSSSGFGAFIDNVKIFEINDPTGTFEIDLTRYIQNYIKNNLTTQLLVLLCPIDNLSGTVTDYCYLLGSLLAAPSLTGKDVSECSFSEENPLISYDNGTSGVLTVNLFSGEIEHVHHDSSINFPGSSIDINHIYSSELFHGKSTNQVNSYFGRGFKSNFHQYIKKTENTITYFDGLNHRHILTERWFYKVDETKVYIAKDDVYLDFDQKLKVNVGGLIYEVEYEVSNDTGLSFISASTLSGYKMQRKRKLDRHYYIDLINGTKIEIFEVPLKKGFFSVPHFRSISSPFTTITQPEWYKKPFSNIQSDTVGTWTKEVFFPYSAISRIDLTYSEPGGNVTPLNIELCLLKDEQGYYFSGYGSRIHLIQNSSLSDSNDLYFYETNDCNAKIGERRINVQIEDKYLLETEPGLDLIENEDLMTINSKILSMDEYILDLKNNSTSISKSLKEMLDAFEDFQKNILRSQIENYLNNLLVTGSDETVININNRNSFSWNSTILNQHETYLNYQKKIEETTISLNLVNEKLSKYELELLNLQGEKEYLIKIQEDTINSLIIDKDSNILGFDYYGKLILVEDSKENRIDIIYKDNKLTEIVSINEKVIFNYENNLLKEIIDNVGRVTSFSYDTTGKLELISYPSTGDVLSTSLSSTTDKGLSQIVDQSGLTLDIGYNKKLGTYTIKQKITKDDISNDGITVLTTPKVIAFNSIDYLGFSMRRVKDENKGFMTIYIMDLSGKMISKYHNDKLNITTQFVSYNANKLTSNVSSTIGLDTLKSLSVTNVIAASPLALSIRSTGIENSISILRQRLINNMGLFFLDLGGYIDTELEGQVITLEVNVNEPSNLITYTKTFDNLTNGYLAIPFIFNKETSTSILFKVTATKPIVQSKILSANFLTGYGSIYTYDNDNIIKEQSETSTTTYENYINNSPTIIKNIDEFGKLRTSYISYNRDGNVTFRKDYLGNCLITIYNDKGEETETRSYNEKNPADYTSNKVNEEESKSNISYGISYETGELKSILSNVGGQSNQTLFDYKYGLLTGISHHGQSILYTLDGLGRKKQIKISGVPLLVATYSDEYDSLNVYKG